MRTLTTLCAAVVMATVTMGMTGCTDAPDGGTPPSAAAARPTPSATPGLPEHLAILHRPFTATDALPDTEAAASTLDEVVLNSQRRAGAWHGTTYWVAAASNGGACLIAENPDPASPDNWATCGGTDVPAAEVLVTMEGDDGHRVSLVSDGYTDRGPTALHEVVPNVWGN
ncbi:hypothetical protein DEJ34_15360 [Curtobacterium sp. MCPF17_050]|uniref:hypothetical protein n=1 Tax=Curtobacterium sp. MCPF17_050 TaxID=2175664 RepID=UPI000DA1C416|nr:hypothetical protein [Curtobacterium sp. MCPF17_050]WIB15494.1 hypothetical protein DEJ34_15360 [Curtobacterium sp. MCPF17_050]